MVLTVFIRDSAGMGMGGNGNEFSGIEREWEHL